MSNVVLEQIHQVEGRLEQNFNIYTQSYDEENNPWTGILSAESFVICSKTHRQKGYSTVQLLFGHDMIRPPKHKVDW